MKVDINTHITDHMARELLYTLEKIREGKPKDVVVPNIFDTYVREEEKEGEKPSLHNLMLDRVEDYRLERIDLDELKEAIFEILLEYGALKTEPR